MAKITRLALLILLPCSVLALPQADSVDLTQSAQPSKPAANPEKTPLPNGCKELVGGGIADGWVNPEDNLPRKIVVTVISVTDTKPALGSELDAKVRFQNADARPVQIPWSRDSSVIDDGQSPDASRWDQGYFDFTLRDQQGHQVMLKSLSGDLFGSKFSAGSERTIRLGESITALVKFKLEDRFPIPPLRLKEGEWQLSASWVQTGRTWGVRNCSAVNGYFHYDRFYQQENPGVTIRVTSGVSTTRGKYPE